MSEYEEGHQRPLRECTITQLCRVASRLVQRNRAELESINIRYQLGMVTSAVHEAELECFIENLKVEIEHGVCIQLILAKRQSSILKRAVDYKTIKRHVTRIANDERVNYEAVQRRVGVSTNELYCSNRTLRETLKRAEKNQEYLSTRGFLLDDGHTIVTLAEVAKDKELRRFSELYHINKNLEAIAQEKGLVSYFVTLTAPANYHPNPSKGKNSYDQVRLRAAHEAIDKGWKLTRARMSKSGVKFCVDEFFGIRFVEAHKDGCAHWHLLIHSQPTAFKTFEFHIRECFPNPAQYDGRFIDPEVASAASYTFKYISKAVDSSKSSHAAHTSKERGGERSDKDLSELSHVDRVNAALKSQRIRQFQLFGVQSAATKYRQLNRIGTKLNDIPCETAKSVLKDCRFNDGTSFATAPGEDKNLSGFKNLLNLHWDKIELIKKDGINRFDEPIIRTCGVRIDSFEYHFPDREILGIHALTNKSNFIAEAQRSYDNEDYLLSLLTGELYSPTYAENFEKAGIAMIAALGLPFDPQYANEILNIYEREEFISGLSGSYRASE